MPFPYISSAFTSSSTTSKREPDPQSAEQPSTDTFTSWIKDDEVHCPRSTAGETVVSRGVQTNGNDYMVFERWDRLGTGGAMFNQAAEGLGKGDQSKGVEGVTAAVVDAVDSMLYDKQGQASSPLSTAYTSRHPSISYPSVLPPAMADFAAQYPLTTVAAIGAISSGVLIGSAALTARTIRLLSRALTYTAPPPVRIPSSTSMLRDEPILQDIKHLISTQGKMLDRKAEWQKTMEPIIRENGAGKVAATKIVKESRMKMGDVPIAGGLGEARLGQVIRQAMEDVMAVHNGPSPQSSTGGDRLVGDVNTVPNSQMIDSLDRLESITLGIMDEIRLLRESRDSRHAARGQDDGEGLMNLSEISDMINSYQASINHGGPTKDEAATNDVSQDAIEAVKPGKKARKAKLALESTSMEAPMPSTDDSHFELSQEMQFERAVLGPDAVVDDSLEVVAEEVRKAGKGKRRKSPKVAVPVSEEQTSIQDVSLVEADTASIRISGKTEEQAVPTIKGAELGMDDFATIPESVSQAADFIPERKPTRLPPAQPIKNETQQSPSGSFGLTDSGSWTFQLRPHVSGSRSPGWHDVSIVLQGRDGVAGLAELENYWGSFVSSGTTTRYVDARVFFNPEPDMIHLDGGIWRCGREGKEYVIRERIHRTS